MGCVCALWSVYAAGASLEVNPVRLTLSAAQPVAALTVRNAGTQPVDLHLQVMAWTQADAADHYAATRELLATPPIFTLASGAVQTVRVGLRRAVDPERELAYRLYLQEIPDAAAADGAGVRIALRIGVPVFVPPRAPAAPRLRWRAQRDGNAIVLHAQNTGKSHARILELKFLSGSRAVAEATAAYVLAGQSWRWRFAVSPMPAVGTQLRVHAKTTAGEVDADVVLE
jgi:fimbrial chaperone protein